MQDKFTEWMKAAAPRVPSSDVSRQIFLAQMREREATRRRQRRRVYAVGAVGAALALLLFIGDTTEVGSNAGRLQMREIKGAANDTNESAVPIYDSVFGNQIFNAAGGISREDAEEVLRRDLTGDRQFVKADLWTFQDRTDISMSYIYDVDGKIHPVTHGSRSHRALDDEEIIDLIPHIASIMASAEAGTLPSLPDTIMYVDGIKIRFSRWQVAIPELGHFVYGAGIATD